MNRHCYWPQRHFNLASEEFSGNFSDDNTEDKAKFALEMSGFSCSEEIWKIVSKRTK
jgi:hypothetical protein